MDITELWKQLLYDYALIKNRSDHTSAGYPVFIAKAEGLISQCLGAIESIVNREYNVNGGDPFTKIIDNETDVNGGYPEM